MLCSTAKVEWVYYDDRRQAEPLPIMRTSVQRLHQSTLSSSMCVCACLCKSVHECSVLGRVCVHITSVRTFCESVSPPPLPSSSENVYTNIIYYRRKYFYCETAFDKTLFSCCLLLSSPRILRFLLSRLCRCCLAVYNTSLPAFSFLRDFTYNRRRSKYYTLRRTLL